MLDTPNLRLIHRLELGKIELSTSKTRACRVPGNRIIADALRRVTNTPSESPGRPIFPGLRARPSYALLDSEAPPGAL